MLSTSLVVLLLLIDHGSVAKQTLSSPNSGSFEENLPGNPFKYNFDVSSNSSGQSMLGYGIEDITFRNTSKWVGDVAVGALYKSFRANRFLVNSFIVLGSCHRSK